LESAPIRAYLPHGERHALMASTPPGPTSQFFFFFLAFEYTLFFSFFLGGIRPIHRVVIVPPFLLFFFSSGERIAFLFLSGGCRRDDVFVVPSPSLTGNDLSFLGRRLARLSPPEHVPSLPPPFIERTVTPSLGFFFFSRAVVASSLPGHFAKNR